MDDDEVFNSILEFFLQFIDDENLGKIANSHLAFADQHPDKVLFNLNINDNYQDYYYDCYYDSYYDNYYITIMITITLLL